MALVVGSYHAPCLGSRISAEAVALAAIAGRGAVADACTSNAHGECRAYPPAHGPETGLTQTTSPGYKWDPTATCHRHRHVPTLPCCHEKEPPKLDKPRLSQRAARDGGRRSGERTASPGDGPSRDRGPGKLGTGPAPCRCAAQLLPRPGAVRPGESEDTHADVEILDVGCGCQMWMADVRSSQLSGTSSVAALQGEMSIYPFANVRLSIPQGARPRRDMAMPDCH